ncbi:MAG: hypothetical protein LBF86_09610 [Helicobacteraceae bacterium]|jgi:hypothetical protein|nr:hypothetical protein [Helicobacteraceae bacterium]
MREDIETGVLAAIAMFFNAAAPTALAVSEATVSPDLFAIAVVFFIILLINVPLSMLFYPLVALEMLALKCVFSLFRQLYKIICRHLQTIPKPLVQSEA